MSRDGVCAEPGGFWTLGGGRTTTSATLVRAAARVARALAPDAVPMGAQIYVDDDTAHECLFAVLVVRLAGGVPVLGRVDASSSLEGTGAGVRVVCARALWESAGFHAPSLGLLVSLLSLDLHLDACGSDDMAFPGRSLPDAHLLWERVLGAAEEHPTDNPCEVEIAFLTSGSSGSPVIVGKSFRCLMHEARTLIRTFGFTSTERFVSLVPPIHIYGFLFSFLVPLLAHAHVDYALPPPPARERASGDGPLPWETLAPQLSRADVVIAVPATWTSVLAWATRARMVVSSAAPLGRHRTQAYLEKRGTLTFVVIEVFGSTETGGIGYRRVTAGPADEIAAFTLFAGVSIAPYETGTRVTSPHVHGPGNTIATQDMIEVVDTRRFRHLGRSDRVVKYSGRRIALSALEDALKRVLGAESVRCFFIADDMLAKGGWLEGHVARAQGARELDAVRARAVWRTATSLPFPERVFLYDAFPESTLGKVGLASFRASPGVPL